MHALVQSLKRLNAVSIAAVFILASVVPLLLPQKAAAYGLVTSRIIKMSSSAASASGVSYEVSFVTATTGAIQGIVVDFCSGSPIIGDTCALPAGFSVGTPTVTPNPPTGLSGSWTAGTANSGRTLTLTNASGGSVSSGTTVTFTLTTATNPSTSNQTFYARVLTYATTGGVTTYTGTANGTDTTGAVDAGGIALSTADQITIQAKVQERLTFCVYTSAINTTDCSGVTTTNPVTLGDSNGVLSSSAPSVSKDAKYNISTNASTGAVIRAKSTNATLTSGALTITAANAGSATGAVYDDDSEQFGLCTYRHTGGGATGLTAANNYDGDNANADETECAGTTDGQSSGFDNSAAFTFDNTTSNDNVTSTYGDTIASKTAGNQSTGVLVFLGSISNTTEPGIYTTTMTFIATGTY